MPPWVLITHGDCAKMALVSPPGVYPIRISSKDPGPIQDGTIPLDLLQDWSSEAAGL